MTKLPTISEALCVAEALEESYKHDVVLPHRERALIVLARAVRKVNAEKACRE